MCYLHYVSYLAIAFVLVTGLIPALIYLDATGHGVGKVPGDDRTATAGSWAAFTVPPVLGTLFIIPYLHHRGELLRIAKARPVMVPRGKRLLRLGLLLVAGLGLEAGFVEEYSCPHWPNPMFHQLDPSVE
jgi:hypothetical protein